MNLRAKTVLALIFLVGVTPYAQSQSKDEALYSVKHLPNGTVIIDDFEDDEINELPHKWYNRNGKGQPDNFPQEVKSAFKYKVKKEGSNKYLHYEGTRAKHINFPLINKKNINIYKTPILSWKWRVSDLPAGANEDYDDLNDTAASIYVVFDMGRVALFKKVPKSIRYTWSTTLPEGKELSKFFGNQKIVVLKSGKDGMGKWHTMKRNIVEDYKRLFGDKPPKKPLAILILSDGDSTGKRAEADYDDIELQPGVITTSK